MKSRAGLLAALLTPLAAMIVFAQNETNTTAATSLSDMISAAMSNPQTAAVMLIEFVMGFALGYTAMKALKYIVAFIGILTLGSALSIWSLGGSFEEVAKSLGAELKELLPIIKQLMATFSFVVVGPVSAGFLVGILVAFMKS